MANVVGDAYVMIHAITSGVDKDIKNSFRNVDSHGRTAGEKVGNSFSEGFRRGSNGGGNDIFKDFFKGSEAAAASLTSLTRKGYVVAPLLSALGGTIGVLGASLLSLGSIIGGATVPALAALGSGFTALAQAAITVKLAFSGVSKAISAGNKAAKVGAGNAKALEKAQKALERAQRALAKTYEDAADSEKKAKLELTDAEKALHDAREQAKQDLEELAFNSEDAAIAEQKAAIQLEKARETLARVSDLPPNSRARKEAELAFAQADLNYRRAIDKNNDLKKTEKKNAALGTFEQQIEGQKGVIAAVRAEEDARKNLTKVNKDNAEALLNATEARDDAASAIEDLKDNAKAADAYATALSELSDEAQRFVKYIVSLKSEIKALKDAAGQELFPQLEKAIQNLVDNLFPKLKPLLTETGRVIGKMAVDFSAVITEAGNLKKLQSIWTTNNGLLGDLGVTVGNLYTGMLTLIDAAAPLVKAFGDWSIKASGAWKETLLLDEKTGKLAERFKTAQGILKDLGTIFGNVFDGFGKIIAANVGPGSGGQIFLDFFKEISDKFANLTEVDGTPLKEYFAGAAENGVKLLELLGKILSGFMGMADDDSLGIFFDNLGKAVDIFSTIDLGGAMVAISELVIQIAEFIALLTESGSIEIFFGVLTAGLSAVNAILSSGIGQALLKVTALVLPFLAALGLMGKIGKFGILATKGYVDNLAKAFKFLLPAGVQTRIISGLDTIRLKGMYAMDKIKAGASSAATAFSTMAKKALPAAGNAIKVFAAQSMILLTNPIFLISAAVVGIIASLVLLYQKVDWFREGVDKAFGFIKDIISGVFDWVKSNWPMLLAVLTGPFGPFIAVVVKNFDTIKKIVSGLWGGLKAGLETAWNSTKAVWENIVGFFSGLKGRISSSTSGMWDGIKNAFKSAINWIINGWNKLKFKLPDFAGLKILGKTIIPAFTGPSLGVPYVPPLLAEGGVVKAKSGGTMAIIGEAGRSERVEPLDAQGLSVRDRAIIAELTGGKAGGTTINMVVNPSAGMDERELAAIVSRQIAFQTRRGAA